ncbi:MAG: BglG family transcription antiterminator [Bacillota bacterium]
MKLSSRQHEIIRIIFNAGDYITTEAVADMLGLSTRTIKRELEEISMFFETIGVPLEKKSGKGVKILKEEGTIELLDSILEKKTIPVFSQEKRSVILLLTLLFSGDPLKRFTLASTLGTSELTVSSDLSKVAEILEKKEITLVRKQGFGVYVVASEERRRMAIFEIIEEATRGFSLLDVPSKTIEQFVSREELKEIAEILDTENGEKHFFTSDRTRDMLALHLYIQKKRVEGGNRISLSSENTSEKALEVSSEIISKLIEKYKMSYSIGEIHFFADVLSLTQGITGVDGESELAIYIANKLAKKLESSFGILVDAQNEFFTSLICHLVTTVKRSEKNIEILNPILPEIQTAYPDIYQMVEQCSLEINKEAGISFTKGELGYLTMHMCVIALDGKTERTHKTRAVIVCPSGLAQSQLLAINVKKAYPNMEVVKTSSVSEVKKIIAEDLGIDIVISTIAVDVEIPQAVVSPFILPKDKDIIEVAISKVAKRDFMREVDKIETDMADSVVEKMQTKGVIADVLSDMMFEKINAKEISAVIEKIASFYGESVETKMQIAKDIASREEIGSTVMADGEMILLHAKTSGVSKACFGVVRFEKKITLESPKESVSCGVVMLVPTSSKLGVKIISEISQQLVLDDNFYNTIKFGSEDEIKEKVKEILYNYYFDNYKE